jgi:hypothetical protein
MVYNYGGGFELRQVYLVAEQPVVEKRYFDDLPASSWSEHDISTWLHVKAICALPIC